MLGAVLVAVAIVIALPIAFMFTGLAASVVIGWFTKDAVDATHEGSELLETNY